MGGLQSGERRAAQAEWDYRERGGSEDSSGSHPGASCLSSERGRSGSDSVSRADSRMASGPDARASPSLLMDGSVLSPNKVEMIQKASLIIGKHLSEGAQQLREHARHSGPWEGMRPTAEFSESMLFAAKQRCSHVPVPRYAPFFCFVTSRAEGPRNLPSAESISTLMEYIVNRTSMDVGCIVASMIYIERLLSVTGMCLCTDNWRPVLVSAILLSNKVVSDNGCPNIDFNYLFPRFPIASINILERLFLNYIQWNTYISRTLYTQFYFALRSFNDSTDMRKKYINSFIQPPDSEAIEEGSRRVQDHVQSRSF